MANTAIENLTELSAPDNADRLAIVDDPTGAPVTKYITLRNLFKVILTLDDYIWAKDFIPRTINGAPVTDRELPTNDVMIKTANFDSATSEGIGFWWHTAYHWDEGVFNFNLIWTNQSGIAAETIDFDLAGRAYTDDDAIDQALGTAQNVTDTFLAQNDIHIADSFSSDITVAGTPAHGQPIYFQLSRDVASDDLTGDAEILAVILRYTIDDVGST